MVTGVCSSGVVMKTEPNVVAACSSRDQRLAVEARDLVKRFSDTTAVAGISVSVRRGEVFALLGPNGAGKTTTIQMLTTQLRPTSGVVRIDGFDPQRQPDEVRKRIGIVFQDPTLDTELTAYENLDLHGQLHRMARRLRSARIRALLEIFELWDRRDTLVNRFSGGMKRRLEIARGLLHTPRILFLDEPTLGLDPQTRNLLWTKVGELNRLEGATIFLTTHVIDEAERVADRVAIIDHGSIVADDTPQALRRRTGTESLEKAFLVLTGTTVRDETEAHRVGYLARVGRG